MCYSFSTSNKKPEIDISNSPIAWKSDRWRSSNAAKPRLSHLKVDNWSILRHNLAASRVQETREILIKTLNVHLLEEEYQPPVF